MSLSTSAQGRPGDYENRRSSADGSDAGDSPVGIGRAHGKAILLGEHAVVYGAPALAIPIPQLTATVSAAQFSPSPDADDMSFTMTGPSVEPVVMQATEGLRRLVAEFKEMTGTADRTRIDVLVDCLIPTGRGLGSSAACARAVVHALTDLFDRELDAKSVFDLVQISEKVAHGRASGVDALATGSPSPILFTAGTARELSIGFDGLFVIADSGVNGKTKDAVDQLRRSFERTEGSRERFVGRVSELTEAALRDLAGGRASDFGARMTDNHEVLSTAGLSTDRLDSLVEAAIAAGALGAKMSGGGLGGCMIALASEPRRAQALTRRLRDAGAVQSWVVPVGKFAGHAY